jgi:hypothetical protein
MIITRHGIGSFRVQTGGVSLVVDPEDQRLKADIVLRTTTKIPLSEKPESPEELIGPGEYDIKGIKIKGYQASSKNEKGDMLETVFEVNAEDVSLVFLGNPKKLPDISIGEKLGDVDIVFAPPGSASLVKQFESGIIVPTFVKSKDKIDKEFLQGLDSGDRLTTKKKDIPLKTTYFYIDG